MDALHSEVLAQIADLRRILADLDARCSAGSVAPSVDLTLFASAREALHRIEDGLARVEGGVRDCAAGRASREETWFQEMADVLPMGVIKLSRDGSVVYGNDVLLRMFGVDRADLESGLDASEFATAREFAKVVEKMGKLEAGQAPSPSVYHVRKRDGSPFAIEALGASTRDASGRMTGFWGMVRDVTLEIRAQEVAKTRARLRESLASVSDLEQAMEMVVDAALTLEGLDCGCAHVSEPWTGAAELVAPRGFSERYTAFIRERAGDPIHGGRSGSLPAGKCVAITRADIVDSPYSESLDEGLRSLAIAPMWYDDRPVAMLVVGSHTEDEISAATLDALEEMVETVAGAVARITAEEGRREAMETFSSLFSRAPLPLYVLDADAHVRMWNDAAHRVFGWTAEELLGRPLPFIDETNQEFFAEGFARTLHGQGLNGVEVERRRKDGAAVHLRISSSALHNRKGDAIGVLTIAEDVTEAKRASETAQRIGRLESLGVLAAGIAHDFNNILMVVTGNLSLARMETDPALREELLVEALDAANRAVGLTARLVTFAKGGAPVKETVDLRAVTERVLDRVLGGSTVQSEIDLRAAASVEADPVQLREVLRSLVVNAKEAMAGGGRVSVASTDFEDTDRSRYVRISISDTGSGIEPGLIDRIFDPYFSTKPSAAGLGLSAALSVITQHGGRIEVRSAPGRGSTFDVLLPATHSAGEPQAVQDLARSGSVDGSRILVVDDEDMVRSLLLRMLGRMGHAAVACASGEEALDLYRAALEAEEPFAAVITDLTMPQGMGGVETAAALREIDPGAKVIVSSGYSDDPAIARYEEFGFCGSVRKPYSLDALREALQCCAERSQRSN